MTVSLPLIPILSLRAALTFTDTESHAQALQSGSLWRTATCTGQVSLPRPAGTFSTAKDFAEARTTASWSLHFRHFGLGWWGTA